MSTTLARAEVEERGQDRGSRAPARQTALTLAALQRLALRPPDALIAAPGTRWRRCAARSCSRSAVPALMKRTQSLRGELEDLPRVREEIAESKAALDRAAGARGAAGEEIASLIDAKAALLAETERSPAQGGRARRGARAEAKDMRDLWRASRPSGNARPRRRPSRPPSGSNRRRSPTSS